MSLPSIKLNIYKKLEYFLVLKKLNKQFDAQLLILKSRNWGFNAEENEYGFGDKESTDQSFKRSVYPTWEVEKKVLFWAYPFHKLLKHKIKDKHLEDMLITSRESVVSGGINSIFENLEMRGFGKCENGKYYLSKEGLAFGELLWYLYEPKDGIKEISTNDKPENYNYFQIYQANYELRCSSWKFNFLKIPWGWWILEFQLFVFHLLIIYAVAFLCLELIGIVGLLGNLKIYSKLLIDFIDIGRSLAIIIILLPFLIFLLSLVADIIYSWRIVNRKYKKVEEIRRKNKIESSQS